MIIDSIALTKALKVEFNKAYQMGAPAVYSPAYTEVPSNSDQEKYGWLGDVPTLREWIGDRFVKPVKEYQYTIVNRHFEATIAVDRDELEDDQVGIIKPRIQTLAQRAKTFPDILCSDLIINGTSWLAYDGNAFFANRAAPNDNLLAGTGTTLAQLEADIASARAAMMKFTDDYGVPIGLLMDCIVCPPELELSFKKIVQSTTAVTATAQGVVNPISSMIKTIIVDPRLTDPNDWYGLATGYPLRPLIFQNRKNPEFTALDKPDSEHNFIRKTLLYGVDMRCNAGYGFYQMAVKVVNT